MLKRSLVVLVLWGCGSSSSPPLDAPVEVDAEPDAPPAPDAAVVAELDAAATPDAPPPPDGPRSPDLAPAPGVCGLVACGGSLLGGWDISSTCYGSARTVSSPSCPRLTSVDPSGLATVGQMTFNGNATYSLQLKTNGTQLVTYDFNCSGPSPADCDALEASLQPKDPLDQTSVASCDLAGTTCTCKLTYTDAMDSEAGSFTTDARSITMTPQGFTPYTRQFCVAGTVMRMSLPLSSSGEADGVHSLTHR
jgi:hypothetical protein